MATPVWANFLALKKQKEGGKSRLKDAEREADLLIDLIEEAKIEGAVAEIAAECLIEFIKDLKVKVKTLRKVEELFGTHFSTSAPEWLVKTALPYLEEKAKTNFTRSEIPDEEIPTVKSVIRKTAALVKTEILPEELLKKTVSVMKKVMEKILKVHICGEPEERSIFQNGEELLEFLTLNREIARIKPRR